VALFPGQVTSGLAGGLTIGLFLKPI